MRMIGVNLRVVKFLNGTRKLKLTLSTDNLGTIHWCIDSSYAIYDDCKGHTSSALAFESSVITSFWRKQKINAKSSTEAELIGVDDAIPQVLWTR